MVLGNCKIGEWLIIEEINCNKKTKKRLEALGLYEGVRVQVLRKSAFNGPLELKLINYCLAIRLSDSLKIVVRYE